MNWVLVPVGTDRRWRSHWKYGVTLELIEDNNPSTGSCDLWVTDNRGNNVWLMEFDNLTTAKTTTEQVFGLFNQPRNEEQ